MNQFVRLPHPHLRRSFTLIELLVAIGIIAMLSAITALSYRGIAKDAKLASAKNLVTAALDNARGLAMKNNEITCVVFRARLDGNKQYVEVVTAKWSRQSARITVNFGGGPSNQIVDRFIPIPGVPSRRLPVGIKVAGPFYGGDQDEIWVTSTHLPNINQTTGDGEAPGDIIGVMYAPDGTTITRNSFTDSNRSWIDFDNDNLQDWGGQATNYSGGPLTLIGVCSTCPPNLSGVLSNGEYCYSSRWGQRFENDESFIDFVPFLAVFDDEQLRELADVKRWDATTTGNTACCKRSLDYSRYIGGTNVSTGCAGEQADLNLPAAVVDRIHFNRYTGVAMK